MSVCHYPFVLFASMTTDMDRSRTIRLVTHFDFEHRYKIFSIDALYDITECIRVLYCYTVERILSRLQI